MYILKMILSFFQNTIFFNKFNINIFVIMINLFGKLLSVSFYLMNYYSLSFLNTK